MVHVPFYSLDYVERDLGSSLGESVDAVLKSNWYIRGTRCAAFEEAFAAYCGAKVAVGVGNGLDALTLMLRAEIILGRFAAGPGEYLCGNGPCSACSGACPGSGGA